MKVDLYTKVVLTVIALCLVVLTLNQINIFPQAKAAAEPAPVAMQSISGMQSGSGVVDVRIVGIDRYISNSLPVKIQ